MEGSNETCSRNDCLKYANYHGYDTEYFWVSGILLVLVGLIGLVGNVFNLIVLCRQTFRKKAFYSLLLQMACFDILFIISYGTCIGYKSMVSPANCNVHSLTYPWLNVGVVGSEYTTIAVSPERYLGICHPYMKYSRSKWIYIVPVAIITIFYNIPRFLQFEYHIVDGMLYSCRTSWASTKAYHDMYQVWLPIIIEEAIPMIMVLLLNCLILLTLYGSSKNFAANHQRKNQKKTAKILLAIVLIYELCHVLTIFYKLLYSFGIEDEEFRSKWYFITPIKKLALMINSSVNFVIYCLVGSKLRVEFFRLFGLKTTA